MTRKEFSAELNGIQMLLREHQYLQYSPAGRKEYEQKVETCAQLFAYLVFRKTGIAAKALPGVVPIESVREPSYAAGRSLAERAAKRAHALAAKAAGQAQNDLEKCSLQWAKAWAKMGDPDK